MFGLYTNNLTGRTMATILIVMMLITKLITNADGVVMPPTRHQDAVAMVMSAGNETKLRLLPGRPDTIVTRLMSTSTGITSQDLATSLLTSHNWVAVDADYERDRYYVVDREARCITAISSNITRSHVYRGTSKKVTAIAVDWVNSAVYWTDAAYDSIFRFKDTGRCREDGCVRTVVGTRLNTPTGVAVSPQRRYLFWNDVTDGVGNLERSNLDGQNRIVLADGLSSPTGLTIDHGTNRVYWLAQSRDASVVETCNMDGGDRYSAAVFEGSRMRDMSVFGGLLFLTDAARGQLVLHNMAASDSRRLLMSGALHGVCVSAAGHQSDGPQVLANLADTDKDLLEEGFLVAVTKDLGISIREKTVVTSRPPPSARRVVSRDSITAVTADVHNNTLYFFDRAQGAIERISLDFLRPGSRFSDRRPPEVVTRVPGIVAGLAFDWLAEIIYWTDRHYRRLVAATKDGRHVRTLVYSHVSDPRDIVVHPRRGLLFWTDVEARNPRIERMRVTGTQRQVVVSGSMLYDRPLALTVDFKHDVLYWSDGPRLCRTDLSGSLTEPCATPTDTNHHAIRLLDIVHDFVVWTDFISGLHMSDKEEDFQSLHASSSMALNDTFFRDILYYHPSRQPYTPNACAENNGGCEHFCLPMGEYGRCACATGYWIRRNGSCVSGFVDDKFLLVTDPKLGAIFQQFMLLQDYYVIPVKHVIRPSDVTFDSTSRMLYWSDTVLGAISRSFLNGSGQEIVFAHRDIVADRLYLHHRGQLLVFIDVTGHNVGVISLDNGLFKIIVNTPHTRYHDVTMDLTSSQIYLSAVRADRSQPIQSFGMTDTGTGFIVRCDVDGGNMTDVAMLGGQPRGLTVADGVLFWADGEGMTINKMNLSTGGMTVLTTLPDHVTPDDVTKTGNYLFWTDSKTPTVYRLNLEGDDEVEERGVPVLFQTHSIDSFDSTRQEEIMTVTSESPNPCPADDVEGCHSVAQSFETVGTEKGFCVVPTVENGSVKTLRSGAFVTSDYVIDVKCKPGYGLNGTRVWNFTVICRSGAWIPEPSCQWAMSYNIRRTAGGGHYVIFASSTDFAVPESVTYVDALAIGGGGGGVRACSTGVPTVTRAGDGGTSRLGRYLRAGGGRGGTVNSGGMGGFGTVFFGGPGKRSSSCLGGGAAGETRRSGTCSLGSTTCPFCGAGAAPPGCSLCRTRAGGCSGRWALALGGLNADQFGGGASGWSGGGGGGGGGYSRRYVDVTPREVIPVTVGRGGNSAVGVAGAGVVVVAWGGRLEDILPSPNLRSCRNFTWTADVDMLLADGVSVGTCQVSRRFFEP